MDSERSFDQLFLALVWACCFMWNAMHLHSLIIIYEQIMKRLLLLLYWCAIIILVKVGCPWHCLDVDLLGFLILWLTCLAC